MEIDCSAVLHMALTVSPDVCAAARAAIRAAEIQAKATNHAGTLSLIAGSFALVAGAFAYFGALLPVAMQRRRDREQKAAYCRFLRGLTNNALSELRPILHVIRQDSPQEDQQRDLRREEFLNNGRVQKLIEAADSGNWQSHATLGYMGQTLLIGFPGRITMLRRFIDILAAHPTQPPRAYEQEIPYANMLQYARMQGATLEILLEELEQLARKLAIESEQTIWQRLLKFVRSKATSVFVQRSS